MGDKILVYQDERIIQLMVEVRNHSKLMKGIEDAIKEGEKAHSTIFTLQLDETIPVIQDFNHLIGFIAAECGVALHGDYSFEDICQLSDKLRNALIQARSIIIH